MEGMYRLNSFRPESLLSPDSGHVRESSLREPLRYAARFLIVYHFILAILLIVPGIGIHPLLVVVGVEVMSVSHRSLSEDCRRVQGDLHLAPFATADLLRVGQGFPKEPPGLLFRDTPV